MENIVWWELVLKKYVLPVNYQIGKCKLLKNLSVGITYIKTLPEKSTDGICTTISKQF